MSFTFSKKERLKSKKVFQKLFANGTSLTSFPIKLIYLKTELPQGAIIRAGVAVPKKKIRSAVKRNRIKRLLREAYRLNKPLVFNNSEGNFAFLFLYLGKEMPRYSEIDLAMKNVLKKFVEANRK